MLNIIRSFKPARRSLFLGALRTIPSLALTIVICEELSSAASHDRPLDLKRAIRITLVLGELLVLTVVAYSLLQLCYKGHIFGFQFEFIMLLTRILIPTGSRWQIWHWQNSPRSGTWNNLVGQSHIVESGRPICRR